jgi:hypothetical protein
MTATWWHLFQPRSVLAAPGQHLGPTLDRICRKRSTAPDNQSPQIFWEHKYYFLDLADFRIRLSTLEYTFLIFFTRKWVRPKFSAISTKLWVPLWVFWGLWQLWKAFLSQQECCSKLLPLLQSLFKVSEVQLGCSNNSCKSEQHHYMWLLSR